MKGVNLEEATLSRPYLFLLTPIVACTWGFLALSVVVGGFVWANSPFNAARAPKTERDVGSRGKRWKEEHPRQAPLNTSSFSELTQSSVRKMNAQLVERALRESRMSEHRTQ